MGSVQSDYRRALCFALLLVAAAGCSGAPDAESAAEPDVVLAEDTGGDAGTLPPPDSSGTQPPPVVVESISIEGNTEEIEARVYTSPAGFPLGFRTVVPADMSVDRPGSGEGDAIQVTAEFGGVREPDAHFLVRILPEGSDEAAARAQITALGATPEPQRRGRWDLLEFDLADTPGFVALGERRGRWFYLLARYPPEYGDGMGPRLDLMLRRWRWEDGTPLLDTG
jgi:hypothetical protein